MLNKSSEIIEIDLFLEALFQKYGYDFRDYGKAHIKRRILHRMNFADINNISEMQHKLLYDKEFFQVILQDLSINVTEMFRSPSFFKIFREEIIPYLKTYPFIKIWHAGCATGEEVYSMAIILKEENLLERTQIYATDFNQAVLKEAKKGIYSIENIKLFTKNYQQAGGKSSFSDYYSAKYKSVKIDDSLKKNIVFADHNLVTDSVFGEMNAIVCRNVLIYFNKTLQNKVYNLFYESLVKGGYLCLGEKESLRYKECENKFAIKSEKEKIYSRKY
ncbi:MAG: protein-glutamate O-methyltransferase CheR [Bacteroidota bacterium]|nr:protein-glutamate O-methyltransferase CheR [Bacteroidota bacterium]